MNDIAPFTDEQVHEFYQNGFLHGGAVLTEAEVAVLRTALDRVIAGGSEAAPDALRNISAGKSDGNVVIQIVNIFEAEPAFRAHLYNEKVVQMAAQLMKTDTVRVWHDQIQVKPPFVGGPTTWHQDFPYWPVIQPGDLVSAWVALADADWENGCMGMVAGSHRWGVYRDGTIGTDMETYLPAPADAATHIPEGADYEVVPCPVRAGHVLFHHCLTWHGAPANRSPRPRPAIAVHYMPGWTRYIPAGKPHLVEKHIEVAPGEVLVGSHFPTVLENGRIVERN